MNSIRTSPLLDSETFDSENNPEEIPQISMPDYESDTQVKV